MALVTHEGVARMRRPVTWLLIGYEAAYALIWLASNSPRSSGPTFGTLVRIGRAAGFDSRPMVFWGILFAVSATLILGALAHGSRWPLVSAFGLSALITMFYIGSTADSALTDPRAAWTALPQLVLAGGAHLLAVFLTVRDG